MKNSVLKLLSILLLAVVPGIALADARQDGNAAFAKGDFPAAVRAYETALAAGPQSAGLYYNLATAQIKAGERPPAAVNLRRALMLDPGLADARVSLSEVERSEGVPAVKDSWETQIVEKVPLTGLFVTGGVIFWIGAFILLFGLFRPQKFAPVFAGILVALFGGVLFGLAAWVDPKISDRHAGVVVAASPVSLLSEPADQSAAVTKLAPASGVKVIRQSGEWTYCQGPAGEKGWLPTSSVQRVVPAA